MCHAVLKLALVDVRKGGLLESNATCAPRTRTAAASGTGPSRSIRAGVSAVPGAHESGAAEVNFAGAGEGALAKASEGNLPRGANHDQRALTNRVSHLRVWTFD